MGCDIHPYTEFKKDGQWVTGDVWRVSVEDREERTNPVPKVPNRYSIPRRRHYTWFGFLAGVRNNEFPQAVERRGMPDDCCPEVRARENAEASDAHSHSWITLAEMDEAFQRLSREDQDYIREPYWDVRRFLLDTKFEYGVALMDHVRMVFWFDN